MIEFLKKNAEGVRLFLLVFLTLYLELGLIRFTAAEVLYLGYFSNFVLMSAFLGIGLGFLLAGKTIRLFDHLPLVLLLLVAFVIVTRIDASALREDSGQLFFGFAGSKARIPLALCLLVIFALSTLLFASIAQETGRCFKHYKPLTAYSIDIAGSLFGIVAFTTHSYLGGGPVQWFVVASLAVAVLSTRRTLFDAILMGLGLVMLVYVTSPTDYSRWSPYQRIDVVPQGDQSYQLRANGIGHQTMVPVGHKEPVYDYPYREVVKLRNGEPFRRALVIGSGGGTDVSYALHYGVEHVDAVEIDPQILAAGRRFHPARPYSDPRVSAHVTDGRAFMQRASGPYDLVIFALPDSLASFSNLSNIRLESFLFTVESFRQAARLLAKDGVLVLYNYYRKTWLVEKLAGMLGRVFGHAPLVRCYSEEDGGKLCALAIGPTVRGEPLPGAASYPPATDDWPFLYMQSPKLPTFYLWVMGLFVLGGVAAVFASGHATRTNLRSNGPFLLMGAAFLLLETKSIIQFSLLFGATWLVNSLVFAAILTSVLLANLLVSRLRIRSPLWLFALLLGSLAVHIALPLGALLGIESFPVRYTVASLVLFSPIFFANLVFGYLFQDTPKSDAAFGWNLVGTMIGGSLEYTSLALGYRALGIAVAALYIATAFWAWRILRHPAKAAATAGDVPLGVVPAAAEVKAAGASAATDADAAG
ncbi:MAG: spermidine synthase [Deltaproteobacteria bacterium]|nr:spermidine synthase [Deltaproteobacteria bacterium]